MRPVSALVLSSLLSGSFLFPLHAEARGSAGVGHAGHGRIGGGGGHHGPGRGHVGLAGHGGSAGHVGLAGHGGRLGLRADRNGGFGCRGYGCGGGYGNGFGGYGAGFGYLGGAFGYGTSYGGWSGMPYGGGAPFVDAPGLPASAGIRAAPVLPPAIYVVATSRGRSPSVSRRPQAGVATVTFDSGRTVRLR